ncbi:hypothetical protein [Rhodopseudomonas pseudopalustris]|nr:hypothetical protein [Rhodopseudomonas pseudopalustris]
MKRAQSIAAANTVIGPCAAAIREKCPAGADLAGLEPVFDRIAQDLDFTLARQALDDFVVGDGRRIVVAISDATWRNSVMITSYQENELPPMGKAARSALDDYAAAGAPAGYANFIGGFWAAWSRFVKTKLRDGRAPDSDEAADICVGLLLISFPAILARIDEIARGGATPALAIALNSAGATPRRVKCKIRLVAFTLPNWARCGGDVAGRA